MNAIRMALVFTLLTAGCGGAAFQAGPEADLVDAQSAPDVATIPPTPGGADAGQMQDAGGDAQATTPDAGVDASPMIVVADAGHEASTPEAGMPEVEAGHGAGDAGVLEDAGKPDAAPVRLCCNPMPSQNAYCALGGPPCGTSGTSFQCIVGYACSWTSTGGGCNGSVGACP